MKSSIELIRLLAVLLISFTHTRNNLESGLDFFIIEKLPLYGTSMLSIVSGYLYFTVSRDNKNLFFKKIKTLAIPYLIANISILLLVLLLNFVLDYNTLNRFTYDNSLIIQGIFSLNSAPINPPTYFIRDLFVLFSIIALVSKKEFISLTILIPFLLFGTLILRLDVAFLFLIGLIFAAFKESIRKNYLLIFSIILIIPIAIYLPNYLKFPVTFLLFIVLVDLEFKFYNTGRFSYLFHLYHAPVIVLTFPLVNFLIDHYFIKILAQVILALLVVYSFFLVTKKYPKLKILSGGR